MRGGVFAGEGIPTLDSINLVSFDGAWVSINRERLVDRWLEEFLGQ